MTRWSATLLATLALALTACGGRAATAGHPATSTATAMPPVTRTATPRASATTPALATATPFTPSGAYQPAPVKIVAPAGVRQLSGTLDGAEYVIQVPERWNGELAVYAHGYQGEGHELAIEAPPNAAQLLSEGFAWAASSYRTTGYVPGLGALDSRLLVGEFARRVGEPRRSYIIGQSMGGNSVALSLEQPDTPFAGGLALCGAVSGESELDYLLSWLALAQYFSGVTLPPHAGADLNAALGRMTTALGTPSNPTAAGRRFIAALRDLTGGPRPFFLQGLEQQWAVSFGFALLDPARQQPPIAASTNVGVSYSTGDPAADAPLNAAVPRFAADPALRDPRVHPDLAPTSGRLQRPLLTLHGTGDLFVPISMEQEYLARVKAAGRQDLLVQRAVRSAGHCSFSPQEIDRGWDDLVGWVQNGRRPAGEDLSHIDPATVGLPFTDPRRPADPGTE